MQMYGDHTIALFADDCKTSRVIDEAGDQFCFQRDFRIFISGVFATPWLVMSKSAKL